jgi:hypothetical protein
MYFLIRFVVLWNLAVTQSGRPLNDCRNSLTASRRVLNVSHTSQHATRLPEGVKTATSCTHTQSLFIALPPRSICDPRSTSPLDPSLFGTGNGSRDSWRRNASPIRRTKCSASSQRREVGSACSRHASGFGNCGAHFRYQRADRIALHTARTVIVNRVPRFRFTANFFKRGEQFRRSFQ